jgi:hypothetical protein
MTTQPHEDKVIGGVHEGLPTEAIIEACKTHAEAKIRIRRQDAKNHWSFVTSNVIMPTIEMLDLEAWVSDRAGGGRFRIDAVSPSDPTVTVVRSFMLTGEGPPKKFSGGEDSGGSMNRNDDPQSTDAVSKLALNARADARRDVEHERTRREEQERRHKADMDRIQRELETAREQARADREAARQEASRQQIESLRAEMAALRQAPAPRQGMSIAEVIGAVAAVTTALAPIAQAMIGAGTARKSSELQQQQLMMTQQNTMLTAMLNKPPESGMADFLKLLPAIMPFAQKFLEMKDPSKQAQMWGVLGEQMLVQAQLAGDMMRAMGDSQPEQAPWMPMVQQLFGGIERYAQLIYQSQTGQPAPGTQMQQAESQAEVVHGAPDGAMNASPGAPRAINPTPASAPPPNATQQEKIGHVLPQLPPHFHNQEWAEIIWFMLAGDVSNIGGIAEATTDLLIRLRDANALPPDLAGVFQDPNLIGPSFVYLIPMEPSFRDRVFKATVAVLRAPAGAPPPPGNGHSEVPDPFVQPAPTRVM